MASTSKMGIVNTTENINSTSDEMIVNMESKKNHLKFYFTKLKLNIETSLSRYQAIKKKL